jgi:hypothetical protein
MKEMDNRWGQVLGELELGMTSATFNTWLRDATAEYDAGAERLSVNVRNEVALAWVEERLAGQLATIARHVYGDGVQVVYQCAPTPAPAPVPPDLPHTPQRRYALPDCRKPPFTTVPDVILADVLADAEIGAITKLITFVVLYRTVGDLDKLRRGHEWWEGFSLAELCQAVGVANPKTVRRALQEGVDAGLFKLKPSAISQRQDIALRFEWDD